MHQEYCLERLKLFPVLLKIVGPTGCPDTGPGDEFHRAESRCPKLITSPKLFTNALEDVFKTLDWTGQGNNVNGEYISHLRFADDIVVMAESLEQLSGMLRSLDESSRHVGLGMNLDKTKVMFNEHVVPGPISVEGSVLEVVKKYYKQILPRPNYPAR